MAFGGASQVRDRSVQARLIGADEESKWPASSMPLAKARSHTQSNETAAFSTARTPERVASGS